MKHFISTFIFCQLFCFLGDVSASALGGPDQGFYVDGEYYTYKEFAHPVSKFPNLVPAVAFSTSYGGPAGDVGDDGYVDEISFAFNSSFNPTVSNSREPIGFSEFYADNIAILEESSAREKQANQWTFIQGNTEKTAIARFNVSGNGFNCLFRCFGTVNASFRELGTVFKSRDEYIALMCTFLGDADFESFVKKGIVHDEFAVVANAQTAEDYLNLYRNEDFMLPPSTTLYDLEPSGLAIALASISGVHLNIFTFDPMQGTQLMTEYFNFQAGVPTPRNTLNLYLRDNHYQIILFPGQEGLTGELEAYQRENYVRMFSL